MTEEFRLMRGLSGGPGYEGGIWPGSYQFNTIKGKCLYIIGSDPYIISKNEFDYLDRMRPDLSDEEYQILKNIKERKIEVLPEHISLMARIYSLEEARNKTHDENNVIRKPYKSILYWIRKNVAGCWWIEERKFKNEKYIIAFFEKEEDAMAYKLRWN